MADSKPMSDLIEMLHRWHANKVAVAVLDPTGEAHEVGDIDWQTRLASVTKVLVGYAGLVAVEEGTITLDDPVDTEGATMRHLLAHAAGYPFDAPAPRAPVGTRRIYSNVGIERFGQHLEASAGIPMAEYLRLAVLEPLGMTSTSLDGSPAYGAVSTVADLIRFVRELRTPTLVHAATMTMATTVQFPGLNGVVPGFGRFDPDPWGLAFEIRGDKQPHWTAPDNDPSTYGHFGAAGTFLWVDPIASVACVALSDRDFGEWATVQWPAFNQQVLETFGGSGAA